jgi:sortase (surface protein transpeptidase)
MMRSVNMLVGDHMRRIFLFSSLLIAIMLGATLTSASASSKPKAPSLVPPGWPKAVTIPRMNVKNAPVEPNAFNAAKDIDAPFKWGDVAWFSRGPRPGDKGRASIYGHLDSYTAPAVFYRLKDLKKGDTVYVVYKGGRAVTFKVQWSHSYLNNKLPMKFLYGNTTQRGLSLITCGGAFHRDGTGYDHKLVVYATMVMPSKKK